MKDIYYYKDGTTSEEHDSSKTLHREDGPAIIKYCKDGSIVYESYYIEGESLSKEDFLPKRHSLKSYSFNELVSMTISNCKIEREFSLKLIKEPTSSSTYMP